MKNRFMILLVLLFIFVFTSASCYSKKNNTIGDLEYTDSSLIDSTKENNILSKSSNTVNELLLIESIKNGVNDEIWYNSNNSLFQDFQQKDLIAEIYINPKVQSHIMVFFDRRIKSIMYNNNEVYHAFLLPRYKNGYGDEPDFIYWYKSLEEKKKDFLDMGYIFVKKIKIHFGKVTKPNYPTLTDERSKTIQKITSYLEDILQSEAFIKGNYKIIIRNFREYDRKIFVYIEDKYGNGWTTCIYMDPSLTNEKIRTANFNDNEVVKSKTESYTREITIK
ncbi:MAG: hypothetical protein FIA99_08190 [Ruminiclostridium sp.]|nr:hypothetical protein [Ruminiclostridium sp.]